jgi:hypothetical protein
MSSIIGKTAISKSQYQTNIQQPQTSTIPTQTSTNVSQQISPVQKPITLSFCHSLRADQLKVIEHLNKGHDVFQLLQAGGGKTLPLLCWWVTNGLGIDVINPHKFQASFKLLDNIIKYDQIPKLVWCVPTRQLTADFVTDDFKKPIVNLLSSIVMNLINVPNNSKLIQILTIIGINNAAQKVQHIRDVELAFKQTNNPVYNQQLDSALNNLKTEIISSLRKLADKYITMSMEGSKPDLNAPIIVGIYESIAARIRNIRNIKLVVFDESHKMFPADVTSLNQSDLEREFNISDAVFKIVKTIDNKTKIAFLSGTINPATVYQLLTIMNVCYKRNFVLHRSTAKNQAKLEVIKDNKLSDIRYLISLAVSRISKRDWGNLIVLFSKNQILSICRQINENVGSSEYSSKINMYKLQDQKKKLADQILSPPEISQIEDKTLREYAEKGFGYITADVSPNDRSIISNLFREKKISVLITTDSVEVGINLAVKNLYIPTVKVFRDQSFRELPLANLNQLLNRAGRSAIDYATIYTTSEYYDYVKTALILTPEKYEPVPVLIGSFKDTKSCEMMLKLYYTRMVLIDPIINKINLQKFSSFLKKYVNTLKKYIPARRS